MEWEEVLLCCLCVTIGMGLALLYHFIRTQHLHHNFTTQLNLLQNMPLGFIYVHNGHVSVNKTLCLFLGKKIPKKWPSFLDIFPQDVRNILAKECDGLKKEKQPFEKTILLHKRFFRVRGELLQAETFVLWWTDMTESGEEVLKEHEKNTLLENQKELLECAWEALPFPAFIRGAGDRSLFANASVGKKAEMLNTLHWISRPFKMRETTYTLTYGQETHTEEELHSFIREVANAHERLCKELPCALCLLNTNGRIVSCSAGFIQMWQLDEKWLKEKPSYEDFWDAVQEKGLMNRVMDFAQYKKQQRSQFAQLSETQEIFLYLPDGRIIRRLMIPFAAGGVILLDEDKTA